MAANSNYSFFLLIVFYILGVSSVISLEQTKNQGDISTFLKKLDDLENRVQSLEAENYQQRNEISQLRAALQSGTPSDENGSHNNEKDKFSNNGIQKRDIAHDRMTRQGISGDTVAFFASLGKPVHHLGQYQNIRFDAVVTNLGNGYDASLGAFRAPVAGVYVFSTTVVTDFRDIGHYGFALNGHPISVMLVNGGENAYDASAQTVILQLKDGDDVSIQHTDSNNGLFGYNHSMFSGFLLSSNPEPVTIVG